MINHNVRVSVPRAVFKKFFPHITDKTEIMECTDNVCYLPFGQGQVQLNTQFMHEIDNKTYAVHVAIVGTYLAYYLEEV